MRQWLNWRALSNGSNAAALERCIFQGYKFALSPYPSLLSTEHHLCFSTALHFHLFPQPLSQLHLLALSCHYLSPLLTRLCNWIFSIAFSAGLDESPLKTTEIFLLTVERYCWKKEMLRITKLNRSFLPVNGDGSSDFSLCFQQALVSLTPWNLSKPFQQHFWETKMCRSQEKAQNSLLKGPSTEK